MPSSRTESIRWWICQRIADWRCWYEGHDAQEQPHRFWDRIVRWMS